MNLVWFPVWLEKSESEKSRMRLLHENVRGNPNTYKRVCQFLLKLVHNTLFSWYTIISPIWNYARVYWSYGASMEYLSSTEVATRSLKLSYFTYSLNIYTFKHKIIHLDSQQKYTQIFVLDHYVREKVSMIYNHKIKSKFNLDHIKCVFLHIHLLS